MILHSMPKNELQTLTTSETFLFIYKWYAINNDGRKLQSNNVIIFFKNLSRL